MKTPAFIFVIDDDYDDIVFFKDAIHQIDPSIKCVASKDGVSALELLSKPAQIPDFIFLDLNMRRMNGKE
jgi:CheY-like chemotaxis protein